MTFRLFQPGSEHAGVKILSLRSTGVNQLDTTYRVIWLECGHEAVASHYSILKHTLAENPTKLCKRCASRMRQRAYRSRNRNTVKPVRAQAMLQFPSPPPMAISASSKWWPK